MLPARAPAADLQGILGGDQRRIKDRKTQEEA